MTAPTMEQMLVELMSAHADFITGKKDAWDYALKRRNEALSAALARYAELEREREAYRADAERLDWIDAECARGSAPAIVNDDDGRWAYCTSGISPAPEKGGFKETVAITAFADPEDWRGSIREAIDAAIAQRAGETG